MASERWKGSETASIVVSCCVLRFLRATSTDAGKGLAPPPTSVPLLLSDLDVDVLGKSSCEDWVLLQQKRLNTTIWSHFKDVDTEGRRRPVAQPSLVE